MPKPTSKSSKSVATLPADYGPLLAEIKLRVQSARIKAASPLGLLAGHKRPANGLGIAEDASLDGFVFSGGWHLFLTRYASGTACRLHAFRTLATSTSSGSVFHVA